MAETGRLKSSSRKKRLQYGAQVIPAAGKHIRLRDVIGDRFAGRAGVAHGVDGGDDVGRDVVFRADVPRLDILFQPREFNGGVSQPVADRLDVAFLFKQQPRQLFVAVRLGEQSGGNPFLARARQGAVGGLERGGFLVGNGGAAELTDELGVLRATQIAAVVQIQNAGAQPVGVQRGVFRRRIRQRRRTVRGAREIQSFGVVQNGQTAADQKGTLHSRYIDAHGFRLRFDHRAVSGGGLRIFGVRAADRHRPPVAAFDDAVGRNDGRAPVGVRVTPQTARDFPDLIRARLPGTIARLHRRGVIRRVRRFQIVQIDDLVPRRYFVIPRADGLDIPAAMGYIVIEGLFYVFLLFGFVFRAILFR